MRRYLARIVWMVCFACLICTADASPSGQQRAQEAGESLLGTPAPKLVLKTIDGTTIDLGHLYGKQAVYLKFWATWCVPCREQMPHFEHAYETAGPDLAVIAINTGFNDSIEDVRAFRQKLGITMPIVLDEGQAGAAFNLRVTPQHIVIGRDGRIQYVGHLADARLDEALAAARAPPAHGTSESPAPGAVSVSLTRYHVGDHLPSQSPLTIDGKPFELVDRRSKRPTVLVFLSPWCESYLAPTRPQMSADCRRMREQVNTVADESKARWLGVASGLWATAEDLHEYATQYGVHIPLSLDDSGALFRAFDVTQVPTALIADRDGRIVRRIEARDLTTPGAFGALRW